MSQGVSLHPSEKLIRQNNHLCTIISKTKPRHTENFRKKTNAILKDFFKNFNRQFKEDPKTIAETFLLITEFDHISLTNQKTYLDLLFKNIKSLIEYFPNEYLLWLYDLYLNPPNNLVKNITDQEKWTIIILEIFKECFETQNALLPEDLHSLVPLLNTKTFTSVKEVIKLLA